MLSGIYDFLKALAFSGAKREAEKGDPTSINFILNTYNDEARSVVIRLAKKGIITNEEYSMYMEAYSDYLDYED
jgi:hypothetical protein